MDTKTTVIDLLATELGVDKVQVTTTAKIAEDLGADSLDTVELVQVLEEKFGVSIPNEDVSSIKTVQDVIDYIDKKSNK